MSQQETTIPIALECELPEHLRQYYLDVMGIVCWQEQEKFSPTEKQTLPEAPKAEESQVITWPAITQAVASCDQCDALCKSRTQSVFGEGNQSADVLIIGEAPSAEEDKQGLPFVGEVGDLVTAMLKAINLTRDEVFITNVIKCQPPNDRDPTPEETGNCSEYLHQQISLTKPKAILVFGRIAAHALLDTKIPIGKMRGEPYEYNGIPVIVTYHPAYLIRKPSEKRQAWQDLQRLQSLISTWQ